MASLEKLQKYQQGKVLGKGTFGVARLVVLKENPSKSFCMKEILIDHMSTEDRNAAIQETEVLKKLNHSNITMYIESFVASDILYIVMELADDGDLNQFIKQRKKLKKRYPEESLMRIFVQICLAVKHVHENNILHRDIKSQNIFLTKRSIVKLGDFGIAKVLDTYQVCLLVYIVVVIL